MNHSHLNTPSNFIFPNDSFHAEINKKPFSISDEFDMIRENFFCKDNTDRSKWLEELFSRYPNIKDFRQQVMPVDRAIEFGNLYLPEERMINQDIIFSLISQHFHTLGLLNSQQSLHQEWDGNFNFPISLDHSQLALLIQRGIQNSENFWILSTPGTNDKNDSEDNLRRKIIEEFEKIIGKDIPSDFDIKDKFPFNLENPGDPNKLIFDDDQLIKATINQIIWIYTTNNIFKSKQLAKASCLISSSLMKDSMIMFLKIRERFRIALKSETILPDIKPKKSLEEDEVDQNQNTSLNEKKSDATSLPEMKDESVKSNLQNHDSIPESIKSENFDDKNEIDENPLENNISEKNHTLHPSVETDTNTSPFHSAFSQNQFNQIKKTLSFLSIWIDQCGLQIPLPVLFSVRSFLCNEVPEDFHQKVEKIQIQLDNIICKSNNQKNLKSHSSEDIDNSPIQPPPKVELDSHHMPWSPNFELTMLPPIEFARQFTIFISHYFNQIKGCELVYSHDDEIEQNQPNLNNLIIKGNNFFRWIQFYVLSKSEINERASLLNYFISVAKKLYKLQNYYGCSLILNTFDNAFASLKATKALIAKNDINFIEETKNQIVNFSTDSNVIQQFFRESLSKMPTIPVIFPYKSSIQSTIKGYLIEDDKIKIPVLMEIFKLVCEFEEFQKKKYNFYAIDQAQDLFEICNSPKTLNELIDYAKKLE